MATRKRNGSQLKRPLESKAIEKTSIKRYILKVAMDVREDHQTMTWLHAEINDQDKSLVSTVQYVICREYETRIRRRKNFSQAWINGMGVETLT